MADEARRKPIEDVSEISAITYGFMASKALFAALEFDLFTHIAAWRRLERRARKSQRHCRKPPYRPADRAQVARADRRG